MMVNWEFFDDMTPESALDLVDDLREGAEVKSPRGATVCTWREAERVLAGFPDGRADEGPAGGRATLVGLRLARENGWTAPDGRNGNGRNAKAAPAPVRPQPGPRPEDHPGKESQAVHRDDERKES
jgi:NADH-quinone oxidoreductase subunit E